MRRNPLENSEFVDWIVEIILLGIRKSIVGCVRWKIFGQIHEGSLAWFAGGTFERLKKCF